MSRLQIRPEAEVDALEASIWYEGESTGLGNEFLEDLRRTLARIETGPGQFPLVSDAVRRAILRRFPFGVFFTLERDVATLLRSFIRIDTRRRGKEDPDGIRSRSDSGKSSSLFWEQIGNRTPWNTVEQERTA